MDEIDIPPERLAEGRRNILTALAAVISGDPRDADLASAMLKGAPADAAVTACLGLLIEAVEEHGGDPAAWTARKQDEAAAQLG